MPLVFAAVTPHPPLLLPSIGKDKMPLVQKTVDAMHQLEQELYVSKPDIILIISPHGSLYPDAFSVNAHNEFATSLHEFGDLTTDARWRGAPEFAARISHHALKAGIPVQLISQEQLDHGATVPLLTLTAHLPQVRVLPIGFSALDRTEHLAFGNLLKDVVFEQDKRVALIASADLAHCHDTKTEQESEAGRMFDTRISTLLEGERFDEIAELPDSLIEDSQECGYRSLLIFIGAIRNLHGNIEVLSYESPVGVGYLTAHCKM